ncbi:hypothetical protein OG233_17935 [Streptomyces sp. NBC_01218]|uniref:hypothetical protein n=1 Tax=Streptomyces sp. NBC_01218 TaxID=2903780 RepID=UPI002E0D5D88|nr:hypothetical protein OG233_17935 [Streptomyces sp. NBC_01218]
MAVVSGGEVEETVREQEARGKGWTKEMVAAERVLLSLGSVSRKLRMGEYEVRRLVDRGAEWLRRGMSASEMQYVLSASLPDVVRSAPGFVANRLITKMPPEPGFRREATVGVVAPGASCPQGVDGVGERVDDPVPVVVRLVLCEGPGNDHMFRAYGGETKCGQCQRDEAYARWAASRAAAARARGEDGLTGDGKGGWRDHLAELATPADSSKDTSTDGSTPTSTESSTDTDACTIADTATATSTATDQLARPEPPQRSDAARD